MFLQYALRTILLSLCVCYSPIIAFHTLNDFQKYAQTHIENPENTKIKDWNDPNYEKYLKKVEPSRINRWLHSLGILKSPLFDASWFKKQLEKITKERELLDLNRKHVLYLRATSETRIFLWSDVHAGFHSLIRALTLLKEKNIINEQLKIQNSNHYFVFNGDFIDRSPYSLETLSIMFLLMEQNPEQIFYIRGKHETDNYWTNFGTKRQLAIHLRHIEPNSAIPCGHLLSKFFDTLPVALYISCKNSLTHHESSPKTGTIPVIRISHFGWENSILDERYLGSLFMDQEGKKISTYNISKKQETTNPVDVKMMIKTEDWMRERRTTNGLGFTDQSLGAITWSVLSTPIPVHQNWLNFFYDAFVEIAINCPIETTLITLYHNDIRKNDGFVIEGIYYLFNGAPYESENPLTIKDDLKIGSSMALLTNLVSLSQKTKLGMAIRVNEENRKGGISGRTIRLFVKNDDYEPSIARQNIIDLYTQHNIDLFLLPTGTPTLTAYLDYVKSNKILVLFPVTGAPQLRSPELTGLVNWQPKYTDEVKQLIIHTIKELGVKKFAFFYQNDAFGIGPLDAAHDTLKEYGVMQWTDVSYARASSNLRDQAIKINEAQPDAIGFFSVSKPTEELFRRMGIDSLANKQLFALSDLAEESFHIFLKQHGIDMIFGSFVPNPKLSQLEIVKEYRSAMDATNNNYDMFSLVGYIATSVLIDIIKIIGEPITKERILEKIESLKNYKFKGLTLTFDPQRRDLSQPVWIETGEDTEWTERKAGT